jgi:hypothetical protein
MQEKDAYISFSDLLIHKTTQGLEINIYRKTTFTDTFIHFISTHPTEHKTAAFRFFLMRMHQLPLSPRNKQKEWKMILHC